MSTRATVWIKSKGDNRFLFHHYDGYGLDEDIDPVLSKLPNEDWALDGVVRAVKALEFGDTYHEVDCVGWDSEYIYVIDVDERTLKKYYVGICNYDTFGENDTTMRIEAGEMEMSYYYSESYSTGPKDDILEKEIDRLWDDFSDEISGPHNKFDIYARVARHFYELGKKARKEE